MGRLRYWLEWYTVRSTVLEKTLLLLIAIIVVGYLSWQGYYWFTHDCVTTGDWVNGYPVWHCEPKGGR